ncbi:MAG: decarboxylating 6-phosphogluconate dehydrogenase [Acidimicrobiales bacterium]|nr:decarboxylating 6-phosphogluconate dehydrogenase [Acidimicrobiales bacterium]
MQLGMIGLGRMGANLVRRLHADGHECVVYDVNPDSIATLVDDGVAIGADSEADLASKLDAPRAVWVMVPAAYAGGVVMSMAEHLEPDDIIIDGGNTHYPEDIKRSDELSPRGIHYLDIGTSGGVFGLERGYCLMIGGDIDAVERLDPIIRTLAPGVDAAARTRGRDGEPAQAEFGYLHCGPVGAGHFVKMVHNGVEYAIMQAYAEGFALLDRADVGTEERIRDAETAPMADPRLFQYELDVPAVAEVWRRGSVVGSWLLDLTAAALQENPALDNFAGRVSDSGEGRWTVLAAVESGTPVPTIADALFSRFASRDNAEFGNKVLSAMRSEFGGHHEKKD